MKRSDPHYIPAAANPFPLLPEEYRDGTKKIVGVYTSSLCPTVFEVPLLFRATSTSTASASDHNLCVPVPGFKHYRSCPTSPCTSRREFPKSRLSAAGATTGPEQPTTCYESSSYHHCTLVTANGPDSDVDEDPSGKLDAEGRETEPPRCAGTTAARAASPDSELAYFSSLSDQSSCDSSTPKSSSRCSNESDGPTVVPSRPACHTLAPLIRVHSLPDGSRTKDSVDGSAGITATSRICGVGASPRSLYPQSLTSSTWTLSLFSLSHLSPLLISSFACTLSSSAAVKNLLGKQRVYRQRRFLFSHWRCCPLI